MRFALAALLLVACEPSYDPGPYPGGDDVPIYYPDGGTPSGYQCEHDTDCPGTGQVCADTRECVASDQVHRVSVHWMINGQTPDDTLCAPSPSLDLTTGVAPTFGPVRCAAGTFTFLKLPDYDTSVTLTAETTGATASADVPVAGGDVTVALSL